MKRPVFRGSDVKSSCVSRELWPLTNQIAKIFTFRTIDNLLGPFWISVQKTAFAFYSTV
jgi:hypothetical protein